MAIEVVCAKAGVLQEAKTVEKNGKTYNFPEKIQAAFKPADDPDGDRWLNVNSNKVDSPKSRILQRLIPGERYYLDKKLYQDSVYYELSQEHLPGCKLMPADAVEPNGHASQASSTAPAVEIKSALSVSDLAALFVECLQEANDAFQAVMGGAPPECIERAAVSLFIECRKRGILATPVSQDGDVDGEEELHY